MTVIWIILMTDEAEGKTARPRQEKMDVASFSCRPGTEREPRWRE